MIEYVVEIERRVGKGEEKWIVMESKKRYLWGEKGER
jgi:hypothetical protein